MPPSMQFFFCESGRVRLYGDNGRLAQTDVFFGRKHHLGGLAI